MPSDRMRSVVFRDERIPLGESLLARSPDGIKAFRCVCPHCGELWATVESAESGDYFFPVLPCENCGGKTRRFSTPAGSVRLIFKWWLPLWAEKSATILERFPERLLTREALLLCNQILGEKK